jgi:hypothetical protein
METVWPSERPVDRADRQLQGNKAAAPLQDDGLPLGLTADVAAFGQ